MTERLRFPAGNLQDPRGIATIGVAEPLLRGSAVRDLLTRGSPARVVDPGQLRLLGMAAHALGDLTLSSDGPNRAADLEHRIQKS